MSSNSWYFFSRHPPDVGKFFLSQDAYEARSQPSETRIFRTTGHSESSDDSTATSTAMEIPPEVYICGPDFSESVTREILIIALELQQSSDHEGEGTSEDEKTSARSDDAENM